MHRKLSIQKSFNFKDEFHGMLGFFVPDSLSCSFADLKFILSDTAFISEQRVSLLLKPGIDIQFFPESGKMVAGINSVVAYKAVDKKGKTSEFDADIVDENQKIITHITADKSGIGHFRFTPQQNQTYKAVVNISGNKYVFKLPVPEPKGYVLNYNPDSSIIYIKNNQNINESKHYLMISVRGVVYDALELKLNTRPTQIRLSLEAFPRGIIQLTLFDSYLRPLAERLVFNNHSDQKMQIYAETEKEVYGKREKVNLTLNVVDEMRNPIEATLAISVIDSSKIDPLALSADIETYLYLTSELKGEIDYSLINLMDTSLSAIRNIDLVMMTHGWRNYLWNSIRYTKTLKKHYPVERGFYIDGSIFNYNKRKSASDYKLNFFDSKTGYFDVIKPNENGIFRIDFPLFYDSHDLFIQNRNFKDKIDDIRFRLDTATVPVINFRNNELHYALFTPGYLKTISEKFSQKDSISERPENYYLIPEITVKAKTWLYYSKPDVTVDLDKTDPTGKKYNSLFQMIAEEFGEKAFTGHNGYRVTPVLILNGMSYEPRDEAYDWVISRPINEISFIKFYDANSNYSRFFDPITIDGFLTYRPIVSFTSYYDYYRGNPKGAISIPYRGIYQAREFYKHDYELNKSTKADNRTTIYWNPEIKTDSTGKVTVSFFNSDLKGKALIRISGVSFKLKDACSVVSDYMSF